MTPRWIVIASLFASACTSNPALYVDVITDFVPHREFTSIEVIATGDAGSQIVHSDPGDDFHTGERVAELTLAPGSYVLTIRLFDGEELVAQRSMVLQHAETRAITVLIARSCRGVMCPAAGEIEATECLGGRCVSPECGPDNPAACGEADCLFDSDCPLGPSCTTARCIEGACVRAGHDALCAGGSWCNPDVGCTVIVDEPDAGMIGCASDAECDDGVVCTIDRCTDAVCTNTPDDSLCTALPAGTCNASGCAYPGCTPESCVGGPCQDAACVDGSCMITERCNAGELCCDGVCRVGACSGACVGQPAGAVCRASSGGCDVEERCDGTNPDCPGDAFVGPGTACRASGGPCDVPEACTGSSAQCPADSFLMASSICRDGAGPCDVAERCTGSSPGCPGDSFAGPALTCRVSAGPCDIAETCTGSSAGCPGDSFDGSSICRGSAGACDLTERCTGSSPACPGDSFRPSSYTCRASAGSCDAAENCTGGSADCPNDQFLGGGTTCRPAAGVCDLAETCSGSSANCPADALRSGNVCRAGGTCNPSELCNGSSVDCPPDAVAANGSFCDNASCFGATCQSGSCSGGTFCNSGYSCRCGMKCIRDGFACP